MPRIPAVPLALAALVFASPAAGQFQITPFGGGGIFVSDLSGSFTLGSGSDAVTFDNQTINNSVAFGVSAGQRMGSLAIEGTLALAPAQMATKSDVQLASGVFVAVVSDQTVLFASGDVLYYLPRSNPFVEFFLTGGAGVKRYSGEDPFGGWDSGTIDVTGHAGVGLEFAVSPTMGVRVSVRDYVSSFDPDGPDLDTLETKLQNDVIWSAGLRFQVGTN